MRTHAKEKADRHSAEKAADSRTAIAPEPAWLRGDSGGVQLLLHVQPGARRAAMAGTYNGRLKIALQAPPVDGRANEALLDWLSLRLGVPRRRLSIERGLHARDKIVRIDGVTAEAVRRVLSAP